MKYKVIISKTVETEIILEASSKNEAELKAIQFLDRNSGAESLCTKTTIVTTKA